MSDSATIMSLADVPELLDQLARLRCAINVGR
jgi:hypothetical protein